ncbi:MAG: GUN4 domain-containing protein [Cyanobacteria bacterium P01_F01_bin.150]
MTAPSPSPNTDDRDGSEQGSSSTEQSSSKQTESPSSEQRFVKGAIASFIKWMPLGGSGFAFVSFLLGQDWLHAIFMFPVTGVAAVWATYTESFIARLREIYADRAKSDADALVNFLDWLDQSLAKSLAKPEARYLRCQGNECLFNDIEGYRQPTAIQTPLLNDVFVPLELSPGFNRDPHGNALSLQMGSTDPLLRNPRFKNPFAKRDQQPLTIWHLLRQSRKNPAYSRMAILAWGGFGKTTLMRHLTYTYTHNRHQRYKAPKFVPVLLYLRKWRDLIAAGQTDLPTLIYQHHIPGLPEGKTMNIPKQWVHDLLAKGNALIMIDGFDEVAEGQRPAVSQWISDQLRTYRNATFMVTSRPGGYEDYSGEERPTLSVMVKPFEPDQRDRFIHQWYGCQERRNRAESSKYRAAVKAIADEKAQDLIAQIEQRPELTAMATNPLLLNMIATFHRLHPGNELPSQRTDLYQAICRLQLGARPEAKRVDMGLKADESQQILQWLALDLSKMGQKTQIEEEELLKLLADYLAALDESLTAETLLDRISQVSELLVQREPEQYEFSHRSFQSYLTAMEVLNRQQEDWLCDQWQKEWWRETILLYGALVKKPTALLQKLADRGAADLAYRCLRDTTRSADDQLAAYIREDLRYHDLETYLKNEEWEKADDETYRLMITTVGKEKGDTFTTDELLTFDCQELLTIDRLWVKYRSFITLGR